MSKKVTAKNYGKVLDNLKYWMDELKKDGYKEALKDACEELNEFLEDMVSMDAFGTEGQLDPRGDQRD